MRTQQFASRRPSPVQKLGALLVILLGLLSLTTSTPASAAGNTVGGNTAGTNTSDAVAAGFANLTRMSESMYRACDQQRLNLVQDFMSKVFTPFVKDMHDSGTPMFYKIYRWQSQDYLVRATLDESGKIVDPHFYPAGEDRSFTGTTLTVKDITEAQLAKTLFVTLPQSRKGAHTRPEQSPEQIPLCIYDNVPDDVYALKDTTVSDPDKIRLAEIHELTQMMNFRAAIEPASASASGGVDSHPRQVANKQLKQENGGVAETINTEPTSADRANEQGKALEAAGVY
jgi:hypothetical protein